MRLTDIGTTNDLGVVNGKLEVAADFVDAECLTRFTDKAIAWVDAQTNDDPSKPFFVYLPYTSPHKPVIPIDRFLGQSEAGAYGDFIIETDWHVGRVLDFLDGKNLADNTMVIFTSDNGPENTWQARAKRFSHQSNGIYREGKRSIYEGGHRVPMFVRWPAMIPAGSVWSKPICQTDLLATFAEMFGKELPDDAGEDSVSLFKIFQNQNTKLQRAPLIHHSNRGRFAIRQGKWKLVMESARQKQRELYDLDDDPSETKNLIDQHPEIESQLVDQITDIVARGRTTPGTRQPNDTPWWEDLVWMRP